MLCGQIMCVTPRLAMIQVIWRSVIPFVHRNLGSDGGHFFLKLGGCANDMTRRHTLCTPEPGFGRGSIIS